MSTPQTVPDRSSVRREPEVQVGPGARVSRYFILERLGAGGMGTVYSAYDPELDRKIAVKLLHADLPVERLEREAHALARISHPNVVAVFDAGVYDERPFVAMELIRGKTLRGWLDEQPRSLDERLRVLADAAHGLIAAHAAGLVHRDFKPENVMLDERGRVKVTDFGLVHGTGRREPAAPPSQGSPSALDASLTQGHSLMGTPGYMAPEQYLCEPTDARTDQFAFAVVAYEVLFGRLPFAPAPSTLPVADALGFEVTKGRVVPPPEAGDVPPRTRAAVLKALSVAPEERFPSLEALLVELSPKPRGDRLRVAAVLGGMLLVAGLGAAWLGTSRTCAGAIDQAGAVWNDSRRAALRRAYAGDVYGERTAAALLARLDLYAGAWVAAETQSCAAHAEGRLPEQLFELREACLRGQLLRLDAWASLLEEREPDRTVRALMAAHRLEPLERCTDDAALLAREQKPPGAALEAKLADVEKRLARLEAAAAVAPREQLAAATALALEADRLRYAPLSARVHLFEATLLERLEERERADASLAAVVRLADRSRDDALRVTALSLRALNAGAAATAASDDALRPALGYLSDADAALERTGRRPALEVELQSARARVLVMFGRWADAEVAAKAALVAVGLVLDADPARASAVWGLYGFTLLEQRRAAEAAAAYEKALGLAESALGPRHSEVAMLLSQLSACAYHQGRFREALELNDRAVAAFEAGPAEARARLGDVLTARALTLWQLDDLERSQAAYARAVEVLTAARGAGHPTTLDALEGRELVRCARGACAEALEGLRAVRVGREKALGAGDARTLSSRVALAGALVRAGRAALALSECDEAARASPSFETISAATRGEALLALGRPREALAALELGVTAYDESGDAPMYPLGRSQALFARALWEGGGDRARARDAMREAREKLSRSTTQEGRRQLAAADAWLKSHP